ncbi:sugar transferase [Rhizobium mesoamericanum]|uniref:Exopolysaccharide production protein exoY n=1 Tax=Rhizobium mesoamericanum STM3625 TaxID=1211777 RepID=K0Q205_9HYPH|nr:sugar transferase [Rhizobium mesoamericanum]CCM78082.1 Exopolysaccharide production protein exoY [Rhizobium mesoamericanum STM3625]
MREIDLGRDFDELNGTDSSLISPRRSAARRDISSFASDWLKCGLDVVLAVVGLILLSPMILMVMAILLFIQGRPIVIAHTRIGKGGTRFRCLKFRTMVPEGADVLLRHLAANPRARAEWNAARKLRDDPRVTPLGRFLRRSSIDEIPQLINVIRGQMSLVGPRPIVASEVELYGPYFGYYTQVRPGLTGLWQVSGRSNTSYSARVELDVRYITERTTWGDLIIMLKTIPAVLQLRGSC